MCNSFFHDFHLAQTREIIGIGESITLAEELGDISSMALSHCGEFLALALENFEVWILKLGWKSLEDKTPDKKCIKEVNHHATLEGHRSLVTGLHYFGN